MSKNVAAINISAREQFGESQYLSKYSNQLVELMKPVALQANKSLYGEQFQNIANRFQALVSAKVIDQATAEKLTNSAFEMYMNPYSTVANGSTFQKYVGINTIANGDIDNPASWAENMMNGIDFAYGQVGNDTMTNSIIFDKWGMPVNNRLYNGANYGKAQQVLAGISNLSDEELNKLYNKEVANADNYNTNTDKMNKLFINATADIGDIKAAITDKGWIVATTIINGIVSGITAWLGAKIVLGTIGKSLGLLGGTKVGGSGLGLLASAGGIALGVAAVGAIATAVDKGIAENKAKTANENSGSYASEYTVKDEDGNVVGDATSAGALASYAQQYGRDKNTSKWKAGLWDNLGSNLLGSVSNAFNWNGYNENDPASYNEEKWRRTWNEQTGHYDDEQMAWLTTAYAMAIMDAGNDPSIISKAFNGANITPDGIKAFLHASTTGEEDLVAKLSPYVQGLANLDLYPVGPHRQYSDLSWTTDDLKKWGMYRQGLDSVPYDNYPALLHADEAVLTASTANELRNLLVEYRNNNHVSANLDAIIQQQTVDLCNKMDEVIVAISRASVTGIATASSNDQAKARSLLKNSMLHMTSTKNALN